LARKKLKKKSAAEDVHLTKKEYFRIKFLRALELSDGIFASDFAKIATEKDKAGMSLSESGVYNYLKDFQEDGTLYYDGRKYYATEQARARFEVEQIFAELKNMPKSMLDLGRKVLETANQQIDQQIREKKPQESETLISLWGRWISAIALYCLGKELETGQPFWYALAHYLTYIGGARALIKRHIVYKATPNIELKELIQLFGKGIVLGQKEEYAEAINAYFEDLREIFPKQIEVLEPIFKTGGKVDD
jgi:tetratricopeptide (TPR) repeat protein